MRKTANGWGNAALIVGILVVLVVAGMFRLLWLSIEAPILWIALLSWLVLPLFPFVLRLFLLRGDDKDTRAKDAC